jgi:deoxyribonuclease-4
MSIYGITINSKPESLINDILLYKDQCKIIQLFVKSNKITKEVYPKLKNLDMKYCIHISYTINIANEAHKYTWWIKQFVDEIKMAHLIGGFAVIVHIGKSLVNDINVCFNNMYINLLTVHNLTKDIPIKILLETSTGQGSEMCSSLEDLSSFFLKLISNKTLADRFGICLDTCHIFNAGYDISSKLLVKEYLAKFDKLIGIKYIKLIHLNDSYNPLGARIDRHQTIDKGFIKKEGLTEIIKFFSALEVPFILETPKENINNDLKFMIKVMKVT